ncbi:bis(5'-nucleosyl)-tetraphosphatase (symmetrical) YqeK [Alkalibacter saccharofermentans]|uniref:Ribosomal silencing factor RsfS n=1 Tax=Alkalibacter saccharofermentans DSM 14828 TaxID=1120975 RepID=A0A1M4V1M1_9FIRM|nr:bis(5'-nucleosyl)-tetraphosphatase (symmetrical) YqeK [Alkalibacter saccharofermentans]SHE62886.1 ribosome silencing factor RsfS/YbeB/iojap [Alkalibacter saccharofermentans DSM 14828]
MDYELLKLEVEKMMSDKRYRHSLGVVESAMELAQRYGCDMEKTMIAAILHDCAKSFSRKKMLDIIEKNDLDVDEITYYETQLMHGPVGSFVAKSKFGVDDEEILSAIRYHTTGKKSMTMLEKIIYLADFVEPGRKYHGVEQLRKLAMADLDKAMIQAFDNTIKYVVSLDSVLHTDTIEARNHLIMERGKITLEYNSNELAKKIKEWIEDKNGTDVEIIDVKDLTPMTDVFVIASGSSTVNVKAIAEHVDEMASKEGIEPISNEGRQGGRWILIDFNSVVVHVFLEEERQFYDLERLWSDGKKL